MTEHSSTPKSLLDAIGGKRLRGAFACRWDLLPRLFILWKWRAARRILRPLRGAWRWFCPAWLLRAAASGTVKKNRELTVTGPYAYTRNPLYLGSMLIAAGFAVALMSWPVALLVAGGFAAIYVPVIASEERFLRATFAGFDDYCRQRAALHPALHCGQVPKSNGIGVRFPGWFERQSRTASPSRFTSSIASTMLH